MYFAFLLSVLSFYAISCDYTTPGHDSSNAPTIAFRCDNGQFINSHGAEGVISCESPRVSNWESFEIHQHSGYSKVTISAVGSFLVTMQSDWKYNPVLISNGISESPLAIFDQVKNSDNTYSYKCHNNQYAERQSDDNSVRCKASDITPAARFRVEPVTVSSG